MMSNALCLPPLPPPVAAAWRIVCGLAAATAPATAPAVATQAHPMLLGLTGAGVCVLVAWTVRCFARPDRLKLLRTPGRANRLNPLHILVGALALILVGQGAYEACRHFLLNPIKDEAVQKALAARCQIACGTLALLALLAVGLAIAARTFRHGLAHGLGFSARRWPWDSLRAVVGYLAVLPVCIGLLAVTSCLFQWLNLQPKTHVVLENFNILRFGWKALAVLSVVVVAPLAEEVFFRGLIQSMVRQYTGRPWIAIVVASAVFALFHITGEPQAVPSLFALAVAMGYNYERTGRLYSSIMIHSIFNAVFLISWQG